MAGFGTRQNNERDERMNINTRSYQFMNKDGFDPSALSVGAWNEMLSLRINPALEPSKQTDNRVFDYDKSVSTSLTLEKVGVLLSEIRKVIIPAIEAGEDKTIGITLNGGESMVVVGTGKRLTGSIKPFLGIYKGINPNTRKPEMAIFYEFKTTQVVEDYDETTGNYSISEVSVELDTFSDILRAFIMNCSNFGTHSYRVVRRFEDEKINAIAAKLGVAGSNNRQYKSYNNSQNVFGGGNNQPSAPTEFPEIDPEEIGDLSEFMNS